jgi:hypothetical protein
MPPVKTTKTDGNGHFDFGEVAPGHYTLIVDNSAWGTSDWFDVEVKQQGQPTAAVTIDVSPQFPDCKGGHEFIVTTKGANMPALLAISVLRLSTAGAWLLTPVILIAFAIREWRRARRAKPALSVVSIAVAVAVLADWATFVVLLALGFIGGFGTHNLTGRSVSWFLLPSLALFGITLATKVARGKLAFASFLVFALWAGAVVVA